MTEKSPDHPWEDVLRTAQERIVAGWDVYQKFTCEKCGVRQTMEEANHFYMKGRCEECDHITDIVKNGHNFMAVSGGKLKRKV